MTIVYLKTVHLVLFCLIELWWQKNETKLYFLELNKCAILTEKKKKDMLPFPD